MRLARVSENRINQQVLLIPCSFVCRGNTEYIYRVLYYIYIVLWDLLAIQMYC